ncbi:hypothetical protein J4E91_009628 [Alternaria rosae]|nr:hypothetical protein J4E91_009628 [Alternaria rosae]
MAPLQPSSEEMKRFELDFERVYKRWGKSKGSGALYFPAKCVQSADMEDERLPDKYPYSRIRLQDIPAGEARLGYPAHITRKAYLPADPFRATREAEWIAEELFEPMKNETERGPVNWNIQTWVLAPTTPHAYKSDKAWKN